MDESDGTKMINEYKILKPLGEGSFGVVSLVLNVENGKQYALKAAYRKMLSKSKTHGMFLLWVVPL